MGKYYDRPIPAPFEQYHHFKGKDYQVITLATKEDDGQQLVIYQALYDDHKIWARSLDSFLGKVDRVKYPDAVQRYRFVRIGDEEEPVEAPGTETTPDPQEEPVSHTASTSYTGDDEAVDNGHHEDNPEDGDLEGLDSRVLDFLDAGSGRERLEILTALHHDITDEMIDTLAVASGLEIAEGPIEERYHDLRDCLLTISRYELEGNRLR